MNIFDQGYPDMSLGGGQTAEDILAQMYNNPMQGSASQYIEPINPMMQNHPQGGSIMGQGEQSAPQNPGSGMKDMSGFANYGMEAPPLQDPMAQMKSLMSMNPAPKPQIQQQQGSLMSYLQQLGAI